MCNTIYIGNTQHTFKKIMDGQFSDLLGILKNGQNITRLLPTLNSTLNLLICSHTYVRE